MKDLWGRAEVVRGDMRHHNPSSFLLAGILTASVFLAYSAAVEIAVRVSALAPGFLSDIIPNIFVREASYSAFFLVLFFFAAYILFADNRTIEESAFRLFCRNSSWIVYLYCVSAMLTIGFFVASALNVVSESVPFILLSFTAGLFISYRKAFFIPRSVVIFRLRDKTAEHIAGYISARVHDLLVEKISRKRALRLLYEGEAVRPGGEEDQPISKVLTDLGIFEVPDYVVWGFCSEAQEGFEAAIEIFDRRGVRKEDRHWTSAASDIETVYDQAAQYVEEVLMRGISR